MREEYYCIDRKVEPNLPESLFSFLTPHFISEHPPFFLLFFNSFPNVPQIWYLHTHTPIHTHTNTHQYTHTHPHTSIHTHTHTHINTHTQTLYILRIAFLLLEEETKKREEKRKTSCLSFLHYIETFVVEIIGCNQRL